MSKLAAIVGPTGSGKSTSIRHLDPKETYIINVADKDLPFKGGNKLYNVENKNYKVVESANEITKLLQTISDKATHIKNVIIEDGNYIMAFNLVNKATEVGYTKFSVMARDMVNVLKGAKKLRDDMIVFYFSHPETIYDGENIVGYQMKTSGKMISNQIVMEGLFTIVLYTNVETSGDKTTYGFVTNKYKLLNGKTPLDMFSELKIPNDLQIVADKIREYYS